jgi:hypothetical protein
VVLKITEGAAADVIEIFEVGFADFTDQETFKARVTLAIVGAHLGEEPVRFATATSAAVTDKARAIGAGACST